MLFSFYRTTTILRNTSIYNPIRKNVVANHWLFKGELLFLLQINSKSAMTKYYAPKPAKNHKSLKGIIKVYG